MSIVAQLSTELSTLVTESRRRNSDIKSASERSLAVLKKFNPQTTQETDFLKDLAHNADFITPFLLSCSSRNAKFSAIAIQSLNKLIQFKCIPISKIDLLIEAFLESTHLAVDIQLRVLQILPTLFQTYSEFISNELMAKLLLICSMLQAPSKIPMVVNTASATQQQLVLSLFDKVNEEKDTEKPFKITVDEEEIVEVSPNSYDAFRVFADLCSLIEHHKPTFLTFNSVSEQFGFELLENVLTTYTKLFQTHAEFGFLLRTRITPLLLRFFSNHKDFNIVVRVSRIILLLLKTQLSILEIEAEVILSLLTHVVTSESNLPSWKKILSLEIFLSLFKDFSLIELVFQTYDNDKNKKKVIGEFLTVCSEILNENWCSKLLNIQDIVIPPWQDQAITHQNSSLRIAYMDLLDKLEPPPIPPTYFIFLILSISNSFADGIGKYTIEKSQQEKGFLHKNSGELHLLQNLIVSNTKSLVTIGSEFLYASLSNELFHSLVRSLQKLCHAAGILSLNKQRDSLLLLFAIATISNSKKEKNSEIKFPSRDINSRHVICYRVLASLTISLGEILEESWKFILITFQWFDYYLTGPSEFLSFKEVPPKPELQFTDLKLIETSIARFNESTKNLNEPAYLELTRNLIGLSKRAIKENLTLQEPIVGDEFSISPFNKEFFLVKLSELNVINAFRFTNDDEGGSWDLINEFLSDVVISTSCLPELRIIGCQTFNLLIKNLAKEGFNSEMSDDAKSKLETKIFKSLSKLIDYILSPSNSNQQFNKTESEMIHDTIQTLYELLDRFGTSFSHSWEPILHITNSPFKFEDLSNSQLLKSSFEILQLILNDFLQSIPLKVLKQIIDVLQNFVLQGVELNVSFSAVSYYWLISDYLRQTASENSIRIDFTVKNIEDVNSLISDTADDGKLIHSLWLYLLNSLVKISSDERLEVRNVAIQTFFRIADSHGSYLDWDRTFNVAVKDLLNLEFEKPSDQDIDGSRLFKESTSIILNGIANLYAVFFVNSRDLRKWNSLLEFYKKLVKLEIIEISTLVYKSFHQIIMLFETLEDKIFQQFFNFWSSQQIRYISNDSDNYQKQIVELISSFNTLYKLSEFTRAQIEQSISLFNNAVRFPFLPRFQSDFENPTELQSAVLESLKTLKTYNDAGLILLHISSLALLPFQTRSRIVKKLQIAKKSDIPSFIAISVQSIELLGSKIREIQEVENLVGAGTIQKILRNLYESIVSVPEDDDAHLEKILEVKIWERSLALSTEIVQSIVPLLETIEGDQTNEQKGQLWKTIIQFIQITLPSQSRDRDEQVNYKTYKKLKALLLCNLNQTSLSSEHLRDFIQTLWQSSFLYENNELETYLFHNNGEQSEISAKLLNLNIDIYSTEPIKLLNQQNFRLNCLDDLFQISDIEKVGDSKLVELAVPFLLCRSILIIKRFAGSKKLVNYLPVATVQQKELNVLLQNLLKLLKNLKPDHLDTYRSLLSIFPLILDNYQYIGSLKNSQELVTGITAEFYKITS